MWKKLQDGKVRGMMVVPEWTSAEWCPLFESLCVKARRFSTPMYMSEAVGLRPQPAWNTIIGIVDGRRTGDSAVPMQVFDVDVETHPARHA